jgi:protein gp37
MHPDWVRDLRDQVRAAGGALFLKQVGSNRPPLARG